MLRRSYDWMMRQAASRYGPVWLALVAFCEGIFFPVPPDLMLMPMVLARRERAWLYSLITLAASLCGGSVGYLIGMGFEGIGRAILALTGTSGAAVDVWEVKFRSGLALVLLAMPIPYKITAIVCGMVKLPYLLFIAVSAAIRGARFFLVAGLVRAYGPPIQGFVEKRLALVVSAVAIALVLAILALRLLH